MGRKKPTNYSLEFKIQLVKESLEVDNAALVGRKYGVSPKRVQIWVREYRAGRLGGGVELGDFPDLDVKQIEAENTKLKSLLGEKDLEIAILRDLVKKRNPPLLKSWK
jgi:transposase-like protein